MSITESLIRGYYKDYFELYCRSAGLQVCRLEGAAACRCAGVQAGRCSSVQVGEFLKDTLTAGVKRDGLGGCGYQTCDLTLLVLLL